MMKSDRPVNLKVTTLPVTAVISITHRVTGMVLFAGVGFLFYLLDTALTSQEGLHAARELLDNGLAKFVLWITLTALGYHFVAGIKHLLLDFHVGDTIPVARKGAWITLIVSVVIAILAGVWIW